MASIYLDGRTILVGFGLDTSLWELVNFDVAQDSILGVASVHLVYTNDVIQNQNCSLSLDYADEAQALLEYIPEL